MICALPRSGSNLLCEALTSTGRHGNPDEWLNQDRWAWNCARFGLPENQTSMPEMIRALQQNLRSLNGVFSHKILMYSFDFLLHELRKEPDFASHSDGQILRAVFPELHMVYIRRRDRVAQAISLLKAEQSAVWHHNDKKLHRIDPIHFSWIGIHNLIQDLQNQEARWDRLFRESGLPVEEVIYEDLVADTVSEVNRLIKALPIESPSYQRDLRKLHHKKTRDATNKEWRHRYEALLEKADQASKGINAGSRLRKARIKVDRPHIEVRAGEQFAQQITVINSSRHTWLDYGRPDGTGWIKLASQIIDTKGNVCSQPSDWRELPHPIPPGESFSLQIMEKAPLQPGHYHIWVDLIRTPQRWFHRDCQCAVKVDLQVQPSAQQEFLVSYFGNYEERIPGTLYHAPWFGDFHLQDFPTLYHFGLGYLTCSGPGCSEDRFLFHSEHFGTLETSSKDFPKLWSTDKGAWLRWQTGSQSPPLFDILKEGTWHPWNRPAGRQSIARARSFFTLPENTPVIARIPWLGYVDLAEFPKIHHETLGPLWCAGPGAPGDSFFFNKPAHGWYWTKPDVFPLFRHMESGQWIPFDELQQQFR